MHYLDTSVLVAFYLPEPMSAKVQERCSAMEALVVSGLSEVEFHSALARRVRMNELSKDDALRVFSLFKLHLDEGFYRMIGLEPRDFALARDWLATFRAPLRTLDALHLAVAFSNRLSLVTADRVLAKSAKTFGVKQELVS